MAENEKKAYDVEAEEAAEAPEKEKKDTKKQKAEAKELLEKVEELEKKLSESEDKYLRLYAEYENFRKRSKAERDSIYADAAADSLKELLPILDNLNRAQGFASAEKVAEGLEMILKSLPTVFEKMNVKVFGEVGDEFDPELHNAIMHEENPDVGENTIVEVFQQGYMIGERIVRFAMVKVAN
ncbi:MAG: nucleotide exchange factor GrpE [Clostridia bacterium]|nr:nucleotide exchange factor GrpE [Clostridia bacterium]